MAKKWIKQEESEKRRQLIQLYEKENKTISEIARLLNLGETTIYDRLVRLGVPSLRSRKAGFNNKRKDIIIPTSYSPKLAEFIGAMLGDGSLTPTQVRLTLGKKDQYSDHISKLIYELFGIKPKKIFDKNKDSTVYFGSTEVVRWLKAMGLVHNKVKEQIDIPGWILNNREFMYAVLRGLFDTDGSIYKLKWGTQISFCNKSKPLLKSVRTILCCLGFQPSKISGSNLYLTRKDNIDKFFQEIGFKNKKHADRYLMFIEKGASHSGNCMWL